MATTLTPHEHEGRNYILVGGTAGMGYAAAEILARHGAQLSIIGRQAERATRKAHSLTEEYGTLVIGEGIVEGGVDAAIERSIDRLGGVTGLAVTAGPIASGGAVTDLTDADWHESFETQLMTVVRACRAVLPRMAADGGGTIVTTAAYSIRSQKALLPHYAAMKSAVASLTKNIAKFHGSQGIRANCIAPGAFATEALDVAKAEAVAAYGIPEDEALNRFMKERWGMSVALGRAGRPNEAGELIAFLLSPRATYLTGALINIDGGTDF